MANTYGLYMPPESEEAASGALCRHFVLAVSTNSGELKKIVSILVFVTYPSPGGSGNMVRTSKAASQSGDSLGKGYLGRGQLYTGKLVSAIQHHDLPLPPFANRATGEQSMDAKGHSVGAVRPSAASPGLRPAEQHRLHQGRPVQVPVPGVDLHGGVPRIPLLVHPGRGGVSGHAVMVATESGTQRDSEPRDYQADFQNFPAPLARGGHLLAISASPYRGGAESKTNHPLAVESDTS